MKNPTSTKASRLLPVAAYALGAVLLVLAVASAANADTTAQSTVLRPASDPGAMGTWVANPPGQTFHGALSDATDSTFASNSAADTNGLEVGIAPWSLPAGATIRSVTFAARLREYAPAGSDAAAGQALAVYLGGYPVALLPAGLAYADEAGPVRASNPAAGAPWTAADLASMMLTLRPHLAGATIPALQVAEVSVVVAWDPPTTNPVPTPARSVVPTPAAAKGAQPSTPTTPATIPAGTSAKPAAAVIARSVATPTAASAPRTTPATSRTTAPSSSPSSSPEYGSASTSPAPESASVAWPLVDTPLAAEPTGTPTHVPTIAAPARSGGGVPWFGVLLALAGLILAVAVIRRSRGLR